MKSNKLLKIISVLLVVITMFQIPSQTVFASESAKNDTSQVKIDAEVIDNTVFIGLGFAAGILYLAKNVPFKVLLSTITSMIEHGYDFGESAGYILEIAGSYIPKEDWSEGFPHPQKVDEKKGLIRVYMDSRFLNRKFCLGYADEIIETYADGKSFHGMDSERIAIELYGHAFIHYAIYFVRLTPFYIFLKGTIDDFYKSSDPIDVNYNEKEERMKIFNMLWGKF